MTQPFTIETPLDDYELIDFGEGRKLERFGVYLVERPEPRAKGRRGLSEWRADWVFATFAATGRWEARREQLPREWSIQVHGQRLGIRIGRDLDVGFDPGQLPCWRWLHERLAGCYQMEDVRALNLFAGSGGASGIAVAGGATVVHVDADTALLERARQNLGAADVQFVHEDAHAFADQALRGGSRYDLVLLRPSARVKGPRGRAWDMSCDLNPLLLKLPRLMSTESRGFWLSPRENERGKEWHGDTLASLLHEVFPGRKPASVQLGIATADGRLLACGAASYWEDDDAGMYVSGERPPLDAAVLEELLDVHLDPVLSSRRTAAGPARSLTGFTRDEQEFVLRWVEVVCRTNAEMAYQFGARAAQALKLMPQDLVEQWLLKAMDAYDTSGLHAGIAVLHALEAFAQEATASANAVRFEYVVRTLEIFVHGLNGRQLKLEPANTCYTDTETLYLPDRIHRFSNPKKNFGLYKASAAYLWSQTWFGTFRFDLNDALSAYDDPGIAQAHFETLERIRLDACLSRQLPGLHREMQALIRDVGETLVPPGWESAAVVLRRAEASAAESLNLIAQVYTSEPATRLCYQGEMRLVQVEHIRSARIARERGAFQLVVARIAEEFRDRLRKAMPEEAAAAPEVNVRKTDEVGEFEFIVDGRPMAPPAEAHGLVSSIVQDFGDIPPEYLVAAGAGDYKPDLREQEDKSQDVWKGTYHEEGAFLYNEWDHKRQHYRKNWCVLREVDIHARADDFVPNTLVKYGGLVKNLRRTFEVLRGEEKLLKRQTHGDDVDIDAMVEAYGDSHSGMEMTDRLFTRKQKLERNIAVMFMVDMSGSTKGWINDAERESLVLLCEALETLGDRYAIYGFSGMTRKRCELFRVKRFGEPYNDAVKHRISGIAPQDYTRMGVTIRHLTKLLNEIDARTKLLITLSDGKPDDFDGYRGEYGIEDTRMALIEAKRNGIHPFCITIDEEARDYLPHMYGAVNYTVIDSVVKLPLKVSDIYRKLTS